EQLAQRVIARYHLDALTDKETTQYIAHRLAVAGLKGALPFDGAALRRIHQLTRGIPRRINLLCDRSLLGAYATGKSRVDRGIVDKAAREVFGPHDSHGEPARASAPRWWPLALAGGVLVGAAAVAAVQWGGRDKAPARPPAAVAASAAAQAHARAPLPVASTLPTAASVAAATSHPRSIDDLEVLLARAPHDEHD